jgi:dTDP-4-amino-4,6-dideoxygalactose transaminase
LKVEFYIHDLGNEEKQKVLECLDGIFLTTGSYVKEFEQKFAGYLNLKYAVGLTSCTAALHLSLLALGIGSGDEVITTPMTFIATATSIIHTGATPVFVDVEPDTALIDPSKIERAITERTKAILPVHLYGQICDMKGIRKIANKYNLKIIEDAAHCIEGDRDGVRPGQLGDIACFSFYATKNITSGEGGAIGTNNRNLAEKILMLRQHGMSKEAADRYSGNYQHWDMLECGWKYNMDNIQASLLLPQIKKIGKNWKKRRHIFNKYIQGIKDVPGINYPKIPEGSKSAFHLFSIWVNRRIRDHLLQELGKKGIGVAVNYRAIHLLKYFKNNFGFKRGMFPNAEKIGDSTISLPTYPALTDEEVNYVIETVKRVV